MTAAINIKTSPLAWSICTAARRHIEQNGFHVNDIDLLLGASGGPKWLVLAGLDRALITEFFPHRQQPLTTLASSIGTWRFACYAQDAPEQALDRFLDAYMAQQFTAGMTLQQVSAVLDEVLSRLLGADGAAQVLSHPVFRNHVVTIRSGRGLRSDAKAPLLAGLAGTFLANMMGRRRLGWCCERAVFADPRDAAVGFGDPLPTLQVPMRTDNLELALRASGAVPLVLAGVADIPGAPAGVCRCST